MESHHGRPRKPTAMLAAAGAMDSSSYFAGGPIYLRSAPVSIVVSVCSCEHRGGFETCPNGLALCPTHPRFWFFATKRDGSTPYRTDYRKLHWRLYRYLSEHRAHASNRNAEAVSEPKMFMQQIEQDIIRKYPRTGDVVESRLACDNPSCNYLRRRERGYYPCWNKF